MTRQISDKKAALLARKEEFLKEIKYFEKRIEDARTQKANLCYFDDDESDDDVELKNDAPSIPQMKIEQSMLNTCLDATRELTSLYVLQSEVNVMVEAPVLDREAPVTDEGTWREVMADCRVDLVPFTIMFYVHQSSRPFGAASYRGLNVRPVKASQEKELAKSILTSVTTPSDTVEVLRSYSVAYRERRTILARLAQKYPNCVFMEPLEDGGYILKCADLLEVSWMLQNKWSPVAGFHHKMKFDLEYMDEAYVKMISQAYKELSDPTIETDERMRLLSKIIAICLEAKGPTQELYESMESEVESENLRKRRTTLDQEIEEPALKKQKDSEVMAPPKSLPKKSKPKGKENNVDNANLGKVSKRSVDSKADGTKKAKLSDQGNVNKNADASAKNNKNSKETDALKNLNDKMGDGNDVATTKTIKKPTNYKNKTDKQNAKEVLISKGVPIPSNDVEKSNNVESLQNIPKQTQQVKKSNANKVPKSSENNNKDGDKSKPSKSKAIESNSENDALVNANKVSSSKENIQSNKDNKSNKLNNDKVVTKNKTAIPKAKSTSNVNAKNVDSEEKKSTTNKVASQTGLPKAKSTSNVNEKAARSENNSNNNDNLGNKKVNGKSAEKQKSVNAEDLNTVKNNPKNYLNLQDNAKSNTNDVIAKPNKKSNPNVNSNPKKIINKDNVKVAKKDKIKDTGIKKVDSNKDKDTTETISKMNTLKTDSNKKAHLKAKTDNPVKIKKTKLTNLKQHETLQKIVVKSSTNSKNSDKLSEKFENVDPKTIGSKNNEANKKTVTKEVDKTYDILNISEIKKPTSNNDKPKKPTTITKIVNNIKSKTQLQKIKTSVINPKSRKSIGLLKAKEKRVENDKEKKIGNPSKKETKIPLGLKHVRGDVAKKNTLRISPRKLQALRAESQNSSKASQVSIQKTGIPRLIKKLVLKPK